MIIIVDEDGVWIEVRMIYLASKIFVLNGIDFFHLIAVRLGIHRGMCEVMFLLRPIGLKASCV